MSWLDQASDGRILQWEPHFLTETIRRLSRDHLLDEPSFRSAGEVAGRLLQVAAEPGGIVLRTNGWAKLRVETSPRGFPPARGERRSRYWIPAPTTLRWSDLPFGEAIELTPFDAQNVHGGTTRLLRPLDEPWLSFTFEYELSPFRDLIRVEPDYKADLVHFDHLSLEALQQTGHGRFAPAGPAVSLEEGSGQWPCVPGFQGIVAVAGMREGRRYLLDCMSVFKGDRRGRPRAPEEWSAVRAALRCEAERGHHWPERSQSRLQALKRAAREIGLPEHFIDSHPRGALRCLVLRECGWSVGTSEDFIHDLDGEPTFERVLQRVIPKVFPYLAQTTDPGARLWMLRRARKPKIEEILRWAPSLDERTMALAEGIFPFRQRLQDLTEQMAEDCGVREQAGALAEEIDQALRSGRQPERLDERLAELKAQYAAARSRALSQLWRRQVDQVLGFCERGQWREAPPDGKMAIEALASRTEGLTLSVPLEHPDDPAATARLRQLLDEVLSDAAAEPASVWKERVVDHLSRQVRPWPERWSALHAALRRAGSLTAAWPQLAATLGLNMQDRWREEGGKEARVSLFLQLAEALPGELERWRRARALLGDGQVGWGALLTTPDDPRIAAAHAEAIALRERLAGMAALPLLPGAPLLRPAALTLEGFQAWWRDLFSLDVALDQLRYLTLDFDRQLQRALDYLRFLLTPRESQERDLAALRCWLKREPQTITYREHQALLAAISEIDRTHGAR